MGDIEWFMEGAPFDPDDYCPDCPDCPGLFRDLWEDLDYILRHTKKDMPKTINYLVSFGPDIQSEILDMVAHMPEEKRQNILCDQQLLQAYL